MQIDWDKTIDEILADKLACPRCGSFTDEIVVGYTHEPWGADYAPRCQLCNRKEECDARKLVVLCAGCAGELQLRARHVDQITLMTMLLNDCRKDLEECLDYLIEYWQDDLDVPPQEADKRLEEFDQETFAEEDETRGGGATDVDVFVGVIEQIDEFLGLGGAAGAEDGAGHDGVHADPRVGVLAQRCDFLGRGLGHAE